MPGLDLCATGICRKRRALLSEKGNQAPAAQGRVHLGRGEVERLPAASMASAGSTVSSGHSIFQRLAFASQFAETRRYPWARNAVTAPRSMHRGEEPRDAETGQPGPHRLAADAEVP